MTTCRPFCAAACIVVVALAIAGCGSSRHSNQSFVAKVGGDKLAFTEHYMVVFNIVPPEHMYQPAQARTLHPDEGEYILKGYMTPIHADSRHFEAHIYNRATGLPVRGLEPKITVTDTDNGQVSNVYPTWMQDVVVGPRDFHYGNNFDMPAGHDYHLQVAISHGETASANLYLQ
jgi:hypothetical protein